MTGSCQAAHQAEAERTATEERRLNELTNKLNEEGDVRLPVTQSWQELRTRLA